MEASAAINDGFKAIFDFHNRNGNMYDSKEIRLNAQVGPNVSMICECGFRSLEVFYLFKNIKYISILSINIAVIVETIFGNILLIFIFCVILTTDIEFLYISIM